MTRHRYPLSAIVGDYARAALGLALTATPLVLTLPLPVKAVFGALAALFAAFAAATLARQLGTVLLDASGVAVAGPWRRRIAWASLEHVRLRWYAARRDRRSGYLHLVLKGGGQRIALDSRIEGFETIAAAAARAAAARGLVLDEATEGNLAVVVSSRSSVVAEAAHN